MTGFNEYFEKLYEHDAESPHYDIATAKVYKGLRDQGFRSQAVEVNQLLNDGEVEPAHELTQDLLED